MSKRLRARVNLGRDKQGKPVYKWASAYSQEELDAEIARIHQEYDRAHHRRKPAKASASPVEPSRVPNDQIPVPDIGASPSPLSVPPCPTPGADSRRRKGKTPVKGSASPVEPSRVPDDQIPIPDAGTSPSLLSVPPCPIPTPAASADATQATLAALTAAVARLTVMVESIVSQSAPTPAPVCPTFEVYATRWYRLYKQPKIRESSRAMYENAMRHHLFPVIGGRRIDEITADELQELILQYDGMSKSTIDKVMLTLRQVFARAVMDDLIRRSPVDQMEPPKGTQKERLPLTMEQVEAITAAAPHHKYGILPLLMLYTGLRRGEAVALRWKDIDFERGIITVSQAAVYIGNRTTQIGDTKTKAGHRKLPLLPILREQLGTPGAPDNYVLYNRTTPLPYTSIKRHWTQLQEDIPAMADATPHRLRHTYLLLLRRAGVDAATQQYLMGHADYDTTANIYTHIDETDVTTATAQLLTTLPPR